MYDLHHMFLTVAEDLYKIVQCEIERQSIRILAKFKALGYLQISRNLCAFMSKIIFISGMLLKMLNFVNELSERLRF